MHFILLIHSNTLWVYLPQPCSAIQVIQKKKWYVPKPAFFPQRSLTSFHCIHCFFHGLTCPSLLRNDRNPICFCYFVCSCLWLFVVVCYCNPLYHLQGILGIMVPPYFLVLTSDNLVVVYQDL